MSISDKKNDIINTIKSTKDEQLIEEIYHILHSTEGIENLAIDKLPDNLQVKINKALEDYHSGNYISHDRMKEKVQQWLSK
jgi:hypothetical protein